MRSESHLSIVPAEVRAHTILRHGGLRLDGGRAFVLVGSMGLPRYWSMVIRAALSGFEAGFGESKSAGAQRLGAAVRASQDNLIRHCDALIERLLPDGALVGLFLDHGDLHVISVGPGRVYVHRRGTPHRLTPRDDPTDGLLRGSPSCCSYPIEPGDVILAGSVSAFSAKAIGKLASVLEADPGTPPAVLATLLTEPASRAGVGAVAVAARTK